MHWFYIVALSICACIFYGIIHDQVTARICIEYFTIGHPRIIRTEDPTTIGIVWGIVATWWVGAVLGVALGTAARWGSRPKRTVDSLLGPIAILLLCSAVVATLAGLAGYLAATRGWVYLIGPLANKVPAGKHVLFIVDLWAHSASYFVGAVGGTILIVQVWRSRSVPITI